MKPSARSSIRHPSKEADTWFRRIRRGEIQESPGREIPGRVTSSLNLHHSHFEPPPSNPRQRQNVRIQWSALALAAVQYHATHQALALLQAIAEGAQSRGIGIRDDTPGFDFEGDQFPVLFENEIHFVSGAIPLEMEPAPQRAQRAPSRQCLEKGLLQPKSRIGTVGGFHRGADTGEESRHKWPSVSATPPMSRRSAEPVSRKSPGRRRSSTARLTASCSGGVRWTSSSVK